MSKELSLGALLSMLASGNAGGIRVEIIPEDQDPDEYIAKMRAEHAKECDSCREELEAELKAKQEEELSTVTRKAGASSAFSAAYGAKNEAGIHDVTQGVPDDEPPEGYSRVGFMAFIPRGPNKYVPIAHSLRGERAEVEASLAEFKATLTENLGSVVSTALHSAVQIRPMFTNIVPD